MHTDQHNSTAPPAPPEQDRAATHWRLAAALSAAEPEVGPITPPTPHPKHTHTHMQIGAKTYSPPPPQNTHMQIDAKAYVRRSRHCNAATLIPRLPCTPPMAWQDVQPRGTTVQHSRAALTQHISTALRPFSSPQQHSAALTGNSLTPQGRCLVLTVR